MEKLNRTHITTLSHILQSKTLSPTQIKNESKLNSEYLIVSTAKLMIK